MDKFLSFAASFAVCWLFYDSVERAAFIYVRIQAVAQRIIRRRPIVEIAVVRQKNETGGYFEGENEIVGQSWRVFEGGFQARIVVTGGVGLLSVAFIILFASLRSLARINILNIASAVTAVWLAGLLHLTEISGSLRLGKIPLPTLVTSGALLALIFVALDIDVRGKAELNKVASLTCRIALHKTTPKIFRIVDALRATRSLAARRLALLPTASELFELTGRKDLRLRGSRLLPLTASLISESASPLSVKFAELSEILVDRPRRQPIDVTRSSIMRERTR